MKHFVLNIIKDLLFLLFMFLLVRAVIGDLKELKPENKIVVCSQTDEGLICK